MKVKRVLLGPGQYLVQAKHEGQIVAQMFARNTRLKVGHNVTAWEYGTGEDTEGVAFGLREIEEKVVARALQSIAVARAIV